MAVLLIVVLSACSSNGAGSDTGAATSATIAIVSVDPSSGLTAGENVEFEVVVEYVIDDGRGELGVGFNNIDDEPDVFLMVEFKVVDVGAGTHTFNVTAETKDWASPDDFQVYVNVSGYPHPDVWTPLDSDRRVLTFGS